MPILFDVDDTLIDHRGAAEAAARALYERHRDRLNLSPHAFVERWHAAAERHFAAYAAGHISYQEQRRRRVRELFGEALSDEEADRIFAEFLAVYEAAWRLFPDVLPCLNALDGEVLGVISNNSAEPTRQKLLATGIFDRFAVVVTPDMAGAGKPDGRMFRFACQRLSVAPETCVYIGDKWDTDAEAACASGLRGVWLNRWDEPVPAGLSARVAVIRSLSDLSRLSHGAG